MEMKIILAALLSLGSALAYIKAEEMWGNDIRWRLVQASLIGWALGDIVGAVINSLIGA